MAYVTFFRPADMFAEAMWDGELVSTGTRIEITDPPYVGTYYGSEITLDPNGVAGGTLLQYVQTYSDSLDYSITDLNCDARTVYQYLKSGDVPNAQAYVLQANDSIAGSDLADAIRGWAGNDSILGQDGDDALHGDDGNDLIYGGAGDDTIDGGEGDDTAYGDGGNDMIFGRNGDDRLIGDAGNDSLTGGLGDDFLDGGADTNTAYISGDRALYAIDAAAGTISGPDGTDTFMDIERFQFADKKLAFDLALGEAAGNAVRVIGAAFGADNISAHPDWVGIALNLFDAGNGISQLAQLALGTAPYLALAGSTSDEAFVNTVYQNVAGVLPSAFEHDYYLGLLQGGFMTQAELLRLAATCDANLLRIDLVGLQQSGVEFA